MWGQRVTLRQMHHDLVIYLGEGDTQMNERGDYRMDSGGSLKRREVSQYRKTGGGRERIAR